MTEQTTPKPPDGQDKKPCALMVRKDDTVFLVNYFYTGNTDIMNVYTQFLTRKIEEL